eukprot:SAG11_NODE_20150_length_451_cov_3.903409_1_plen_38_part_10
MEQWQDGKTQAGTSMHLTLLMYLYTNQGGRRIQRGPRT